MDFKSKLCISLLLAVVIFHTDGAITDNTTTIIKPSTNSSAAISIEPTTTGSSSLSSSQKHVSTEITTKAPLKCNVGKCEGDECTNKTIIAAYKTELCRGGACQTIKTVDNGTTTYNFKCTTTKNCATATKTAGTTVTCCNSSNCNIKHVPKDEKSASGGLNTFTAIMIFIFFIILI